MSCTITSETESATRRRELAARKQQVTRDAIVEGVIAAIRDSGVDFSVQQVAEHAGVTARTVYRYFPTRHDLLDAADRWGAEQFARAGGPEPATVEEIPATFERLYQDFEAHPDGARAAVLLSSIESQASPSRTERTERMRALLAAEVPDLAALHVTRAFAVIRLLASSMGWYVMASDTGLRGEDTGPAVRWALGTLIADLRRRNIAAAE